jgi:hypothetical protein
VDIGNCVLKFSAHQDDNYVAESIDYVFSKYNWEPITEYGINRWIGPNQVRFQINKPITFFKTYRGTYGDMQPHDSDPVDAFSVCVQKTCPLLYEGKIYKCSTVALLNRVLTDWKQSVDDQWKPYAIDYHPLTLDSNAVEIDNFLKNFGKPHSICRMCPTSKDQSSFIDHKANVITKKQWIRLHRF